MLQQLSVFNASEDDGEMKLYVLHAVSCFICCLFSDELFLHFGSFCFMMCNMHCLLYAVVCSVLHVISCCLRPSTPQNSEKFAGLTVASPLSAVSCTVHELLQAILCYVCILLMLFMLSCAKLLKLFYGATVCMTVYS